MFFLASDACRELVVTLRRALQLQCDLLQAEAVVVMLVLLVGFALITIM